MEHVLFVLIIKWVAAYGDPLLDSVPKYKVLLGKHQTKVGSFASHWLQYSSKLTCKCRQKNSTYELATLGKCLDFSLPLSLCIAPCP